MFRLILSLMLLLAAGDIAAAQVPGATPVPQFTPIPQSTPMIPPRPSNRNPQTPAAYSPNAGETNAVPPDGLALNFLIVQKYAAPMYRNPTTQELSAIAPSADVQNRFQEFLRRPKTGIVRLVADAGCSESTNVVAAFENCLKYTMPGAGSSFSFRTGNYRMSRLADLTLSGENFTVTGEMMHAILTRLGDVPLENVSLASSAARFLVDFQPATDVDSAREIDQTFIKGVEKSGFLYARKAAAELNTTYLLRVVAYRGSISRTVNGATYDELDFDKRQDVAVAFRAVDKGADGSFTIIWVELNRADAPKIKAKNPKR